MNIEKFSTYLAAHREIACCLLDQSLGYELGDGRLETAARDLVAAIDDLMGSGHSILTHGLSKNCPMVQSGKWQFCKGHRVPPDNEETPELVKARSELFNVTDSISLLLKQDELRGNSSEELTEERWEAIRAYGDARVVFAMAGGRY